MVGISSLAAIRGVPGGSVYGATKAGLTNFLEGLRIELVNEAPNIVVTAASRAILLFFCLINKIFIPIFFFKFLLFI